MCITEYDEVRTMNMIREEGIEEGREEGREEGQNKLGRLITVLISQGRMDEIGLAAKDAEFRNRLYEELQIS